MKNLVIFFSSIILLSACSSLEEAGKVLRNEKINTTDEFLVKKKEPLVLPPDYSKIPEPNSSSSNKENDEKQKIKKILKVPKDVTSETNKLKSTEETILRNILK